MAIKHKKPTTRLARMEADPIAGSQVEIDLNDSKQWATVARQALDVSKLHSSMKIGFEALGLDARDPKAWKWLLLVLCQMEFGQQKEKRGPKKKWGEVQLAELRIDYCSVEARNPEKSVSNICKLMKSNKSFKNRFWFNKSTEAIRRYLPRAVDQDRSRQS